MTQKDKELLLKDLCASLPYNLYIRVEEFNVPKNEAITEGFVGNYLKDNRCNDYDADDILNELADDCINVKPYLRPMSNMTEEEEAEYYSLGIQPRVYDIDYLSVDWLNAHHFDYRGLIEKGLAIKASNETYKR